MPNKLRQHVILWWIVAGMGCLLLPGQLTAQNTDCHTSSNIQRVSVSSSGEQANEAMSDSVGISYNGQFISMLSRANNLVAGDTTIDPDLFIYNRETCEMIWASQDLPFVYEDDTELSYDGNIVTFTEGTGWGARIYSKDLSTGQATLVSVLPDGQPSQSNFSTRYHEMSGNGRYISFETTSGLYLFDRLSGVSKLISAQSKDQFMSISADGRFVAFITKRNPNNPSSEMTDVYLYDRVTNGTRLISKTPTGGYSNGVAYRTDISGNGRYVVFSSEADNLTPGATDLCTRTTISRPCVDLFMYDTQTGTMSLLTPNTNDSYFNVMYMSDDGRYVAALAYPPYADFYPRRVVIIDTRTLQRVDLFSGEGTGIENAITGLDMSGDGHYVVVVSNAAAWVEGDTNGFDDVFVVTNPLWESVEVPVRNYYTSLPFQLTWAGVTGATQYQVQVDDDRNFTAPILINSMTQTTSFDVTTLENGTYYWRVRADKGTNEWGSWSAVDSFVVDVP